MVQAVGLVPVPRASVHEGSRTGRSAGRPRDDRDVAQDLARELAAAQLGSLKGEANAWLSEESYDALKHRLENAPAAVEPLALVGPERLPPPMRVGRSRRGCSS